MRESSDVIPHKSHSPPSPGLEEWMEHHEEEAKTPVKQKSMMAEHERLGHVRPEEIELPQVKILTSGKPRRVGARRR